MACESGRDKLDGYVDGELPPAEARALAVHVRQCADCAADALQRVQMKRAIATAGKRYDPSAEFREKIRKSLVKSPRRRGAWFWKLALAPAALVLLLSLAVNWYVDREKGRRQRVYSELADLHVATLASANPVDVVSTDRHTVKPWFAGKIPFTFNLPELQNTEFTLIGGRVTYLGQSPGAQLIYGIRKHQISVFIFQDRGGDSASLPSSPVQEFSFHVESWTKNGLRYFVVGDVGNDDLEALGKLLRDAS
jgi:anti-sigma factor RsiW